MPDTAHSQSPAGRPQFTLWQKALREVSRPFRKKKKRRHLRSDQPFAVPAPAGLASFDPASCTVEPDGLELLKGLVRKAAHLPGPIIEIGTLVGITATHMALVKGPDQKIITVDNYCWNPWNLAADDQFALAQQILYYLIETGHVEQVRMSKDDFFASYSGPAPALVFLDAWHTYEETKKDIEWAQRVGAKLIAGHDYCDLWPGVKQIVDECGGPAAVGGSVWVLHADQRQIRIAA